MLYNNNHKQYGIKKTKGSTALQSFIKVRQKKQDANNTSIVHPVQKSVSHGAKLKTKEAKPQKIKIELLNDEPNDFTHKYLMCTVITVENEPYVINEANYLAAGVQYKNKEFKLEDIKKYIIEKKLLKEYELFVFNNSSVDRNILFFRMYENELHSIGSMSVGGMANAVLMRLLDYVNDGQKRFFTLLPEVLN